MMNLSLWSWSNIMFLFFTVLVLLSSCDGWRAVPANQAMYALRTNEIGLEIETDIGMNTTGKYVMPDDLLPKDRLNHVYKFGWCKMDVTVPQFLRKAVNVTLPTWSDTQAEFIYLIERKHTQRYRFQCIVMKTYVNRKYILYKSRLPLYYCQGTVLIMMLNTVRRLEIHEFYFHLKLAMPCNFAFEFYHAPPL